MDALNQLYHYLEQGGAVMIPLVICSCVMWALIVERMIYFYRLEKRGYPFSQPSSYSKTGKGTPIL